MTPWFRRARGLRDPRQERGLRDAQLAGRLPEVSLARAADSHDAIPEGHAVEILLEDLVLAHDLLERERAERLERLGPQSMRTSVGELHGLLGERRAPRQPHARDEHRHEPAPRREQIHSVVFGEARVLYRDERIDEVRGDVAQAHPAAILTIGTRQTERHPASIGHRQG